jgi:hypothetical protein
MDKFKYLEYFNTSLRNALQYPEKFTIVLDENRITLDPDRESELLKLINSDTSLKEKLLQVITTNIKKDDPSAYDVHFEPDRKYIIISYKSRKIIVQLDIGIHSIIASYLDEFELSIYCKSNSEFEKVCVKPEFWVTLIRVRYPEYFIQVSGGYNWERVYHGLSFYDESKKMIEYNFSNLSSRMYMYMYSHDAEISIYRERDELFVNLDKHHHETFMYLLMNFKLKLSLVQIEHILFNTQDTSVISYILDNYQINNLILETIWNHHLRNLKINKLLLSYHGIDSRGNPIEITTQNITNTILPWIIQGNYKLNPEEFQLYFDKLYPRGDFDDMISFLLQSRYFDPNILRYVFNKLSDVNVPKNLHTHMLEAINNNRFEVIIMLWIKYHRILLPHLAEFRQIVETTYPFSTDKYTILNILI